MPPVTFAPADIRELRKLLSETQAVFGRRFSVSQGVVSQWELGRRKPTEGEVKQLMSLWAVHGQGRPLMLSRSPRRPHSSPPVRSSAPTPNPLMAAGRSGPEGARPAAKAPFNPLMAAGPILSPDRRINLDELVDAGWRDGRRVYRPAANDDEDEPD